MSISEIVVGVYVVGGILTAVAIVADRKNVEGLGITFSNSIDGFTQAVILIAGVLFWPFFLLWMIFRSEEGE